jgi:hypothetical protein
MDITHMMGLWGAPTMGTFSLVLLALVVWGFFWKGFGLWYSAKRGDSWWFVAILLLNTAGILEIIYIFFIAKIPQFRHRIGL